MCLWDLMQLGMNEILVELCECECECLFERGELGGGEGLLLER